MILILLVYCQSQNKLIDVGFIYTFALFPCAGMVLIFSMRLREMLHNLCQTIDPDLLEDYEPYEYADSVTVSNDVTVPQDCDLFYLDCDLGEFAAALYLDKGMFYAIYFFFKTSLRLLGYKISFGLVSERTFVRLYHLKL